MSEKETKYSEAITELEAILAKMQSPDCDIDNLSQYAARAIELLKLCRTKLTRTDEELKKSLETLA